MIVKFKVCCIGGDSIPMPESVELLHEGKNKKLHFATQVFADRGYQHLFRRKLRSPNSTKLALRLCVLSLKAC
jgi:lactam utilization protein B